MEDECDEAEPGNEKASLKGRKRTRSARQSISDKSGAKKIKQN
jgi:hypothetical protein